MKAVQDAAQGLIKERFLIEEDAARAASEELYEKLPLLGVLMRWLKRQARS